MTVFATKPLLLDAILVVPTLLFILLPARSQPSLPSARSTSIYSFSTFSKNTATDSNEVVPQAIIVKPLPALTTYRTHMLVMTSLCILAVDFPVFPRYLAKCETFGVSLVSTAS